MVAVRWALLGLNFAALAFFGHMSFAFFVSEPDELETATPNFARMEIKKDTKGAASVNLAQPVMRVINATAPPPKPDRKPTVKSAPTEVAVTAGPLEEWEIDNVVILDGTRVAFVRKGADPQAQATEKPARSRRSAGRRSRSTRNKSRSSRGRTPARGGTLFSTMIEGELFRKTEYLVTRVDVEEVEYEDPRGKQFRIMRENYNPGDFSGGLAGKEPEETPEGPVSSVPPDEKGQIDFGGRARPKRLSPSRGKTSSRSTPARRGKPEPSRLERELESAELNDADREALKKALDMLGDGKGDDR